MNKTKIEFSVEQKYIEFDDIFNSVFYGKNQKNHRDIARKFVDIVKRKGELNTSKKVWRTVCESFNLNPDSTKDTSLFYYIIDKLLRAGLVEKTGFTYKLSYRFCEKFQELTDLWLKYKNRTEEIEEEE